MQKSNDMKQLIKLTVKEAVEKTNPEKIILFGSYAYGNPTKDSDVDLLIIQNTHLSGTKRYCAVINNIPHLFAMDLLVKTPAEIKKRLKMGDPFYKEIMQKGKVLYDASK